MRCVRRKNSGFASISPLGERRRLNQEEPPEVARGKLLIGSLVHGQGGCDVQYRDVRQVFSVVQGHAVRDPSASIKTDHRKAVVPQGLHDGQLILR